MSGVLTACTGEDAALGRGVASAPRGFQETAVRPVSSSHVEASWNFQKAEPVFLFSFFLWSLSKLIRS